MSAQELVLGNLWRLRLAAAGSALEHLALMRRWAALDATEVASLQRERLERLLAFAHAHVPYYRRLLERYGAVVGGKVNVERFTDLPLLDKPTIRSNWDELCSDDCDRRRTRINQSGGSTGEPVKLIQDADYQDWNNAVKLFFEERAGYRLGERVIELWGSERDIMGARRSLWSRAGQRVRNKRFLNTFRMTPATMRAYVEEINAFRPSLIVAYAESIFRIARFARQEGLELFTPKTIFTSASTLHAPMRAAIEEVFGTRVYDRYGSREVGVVACETPGSSGPVVSAPSHYVEIVRPDGTVAEPGETGEIVVTPLTNFAMPLLRYRIGDMGSWSRRDDPGAIAWPTLARISGRVSDTFFTRDGTQVFGEFFTHLFYERDWVEMFQVVQEELDLVVIRIKPGPRAPAGAELEEEVGSLRQQVRLVMGEGCRVEVEFTDEIETTVSGKHRFTISKVEAPEVVAH
ncbi:MAG TPA: hypothetical protein VF168_07090 [Trueperaceae bacterium]